MYARQPPEGRPPRPLRVPRNYSGNAFSREEPILSASTEEPAEPIPPETTAEAVSAETEQPSSPRSEPPTDAAPTAAKLFSAPGFRLDFGRLFRKDRGFGIGTEELLLLGLILLISQSNTKDDLLFLLLLLLFVE
ncbi:MAG: hypothetical protein E7668_04090 [Ruminococcaceae bacterium]|nr:hypothetical protein [Oscillospiraceae bacterium]